jgi:hypothetical protein
MYLGVLRNFRGNKFNVDCFVFVSDIEREIVDELRDYFVKDGPVQIAMVLHQVTMVFLAVES